MAREYKVKRYSRKSGNMYGSNGPNIGKWLLTIVLVAALVYLGIVLYEPVVNLLTGNIVVDDPQLEEMLSDPSVDVEGEQDPEVQPEENPETDAMRAAYLPTATISSETALNSFLASLEGTGINAVMVDIKNSDGEVLFDCEFARPHNFGAVVENPYNLKSLADTLEEHNLRLVVRMSAFQDPIAAYTARVGSIHYMDTDGLWVDDYPGIGKPWLNPYSPDALEYLATIALEAVDAGAEMVVLENVRFPDNSQVYATFGAESEGISRSQALRNFTSNFSQRMAEKDARTAVYLTTLSLTQATQNEVRYGGSPAAILDEYVILGALPYQFSTTAELGERTVENPVQNPAAVVTAVVEYARGQIAATDSHPAIIPLMQGGNEEANSANPYTAAEVGAQIKAAEDLELEEYILYNSGGQYLFE